MVTEMVARFATMLDVSPTGFNGRRRQLTEHLTCPACGAHHTEVIGGSASDGYPVRSGERSWMISRSDAVLETPTHQCRDCAHQWVRSLPDSNG
jgi:hypothetical protein